MGTASISSLLIPNLAAVLTGHLELASSLDLEFINGVGRSSTQCGERPTQGVSVKDVDDKENTQSHL